MKVKKWAIDNKYYLIGGGAFLIFYFFVLSDHNSDIKDINENLAQTTGEIVAYSSCFKGGRCIDYIYIVKGQHYKVGSRLDLDYCKKGSCLHKFYTVEYSEKNPEKSRIIIEGKAFYRLEGFWESLGITTNKRKH